MMKFNTSVATHVAHFRHVRGQLVQVSLIFISDNLAAREAAHGDNHPFFRVPCRDAPLLNLRPFPGPRPVISCSAPGLSPSCTPGSNLYPNNLYPWSVSGVSTVAQVQQTEKYSTAVEVVDVWRLAMQSRC